MATERKNTDLTGQRFGKLTVIERGENKYNGQGERQITYICRCDCGNTKQINGYCLTHGITKSCGCLLRNHAAEIGGKNFNDLTGRKFGKLTALRRGENEYAGKNRQPKTTWICQCDCGNIKTVWAERLIRGAVTNCGCWHEEKSKEREALRVKKYEEKPQCTIFDKRLKSIYKGMKERCNTESCVDYNNYGGRGIKICDEWDKRNGFWTFRDWALANGYADNLQIDRIDVNKWYSPDNCRWVTSTEQQNNRRNNVYIEVNGITHTLAEWSRITNMDYSKMLIWKNHAYDLLVNHIRENLNGQNS